MLIRVGLDQWIAVSGTNPNSTSRGHLVGLNTAGLSGCVAIGLAWDDVISLAHVYSDCTEATWLANGNGPGYMQTLTAAFHATSALRPQARPSGVLVYSEGTPRWLPRQLGDWLAEAHGVDPEEGMSPTCRIWVEDERLHWSNQLAENPADNNRYTTSANAATPILAYQALSPAAAAASPPHGEGD
ncbi:hypothetical protein J5226_01330 [Lysobacter sp. K5869]|uniref:hypothetical protein n=1 Tax=Lysobacter sp. K5869 TaxID=2820808 RepID=UPI001C0628FF|nr:hypothetical protein [Lysobacter sp. K5869]QWP77077.1 hypothetical protein J5226_01330 [Lysobacter sp. K5869]